MIKVGECENTWIQWGAPTEVLGDNVNDLNKFWRALRLKGLVRHEVALPHFPTV